MSNRKLLQEFTSTRLGPIQRAKLVVSVLAWLNGEPYLTEKPIHWNVPFPDDMRPEDVAFVNASFRVELSKLFDQWIDSGRGPDGFESPGSRFLNRAPEGYSEALFDVMSRWLARNPPTTGFLSTGLPVTYWEAPPLPTDSLALLALIRGIKTPLIEAARSHAIFWLREILGMLDWRARIARCSRCGVYYRLSHPKRTYKGGTRCAKCQRIHSLESAKRATYNDRRYAERCLWSLAGKRFARRIARTPEWQKDRKLKESIVAFLQERIDQTPKLKTQYPLGITLKWLGWTKNQTPIETEARKADEHAKSKRT